MDSNNLRQFFLDKMSIKTIVSDAVAEVDEFRRARAKTGSSAHIIVTNETFEFLLGSTAVKKLCETYLHGELDEWQLEYMANVLEFSDAFLVEDEQVADAIFALSSPEVNGDLTPERVRAIHSNLG